MTDAIQIKNALISVWDKTGLDELAKRLNAKGVRIFGTMGTGGYLRDKLGIDVVSIESLTQFPEMMEGRVKTLHPKIFGGILARRDVPKDLSEATEHQVPLFDLVVGNLYPFWEKLGQPTKAQSSFVDIGGPSLLRAASKNHEAVLVLSSPTDYESFYDEWESNQGATRLNYRKKQAGKTFLRTSQYDAMIASEWTDKSDAAFPHTLHFAGQKPLRYGENPHQKAAWAGEPTWEVLQGKELSYNNLLDAQAAHGLCREFSEPAAVIVKHNNPCGTASFNGATKDVFETALRCDEKSAFGGIVAMNREVDGATAQSMAPIFFEVILAPRFSEEAKAILSAKKNLRLIEWKNPVNQTLDIRWALGGWLLQAADNEVSSPEFKTVTSRAVDTDALADLRFAWKVVKHVKSNAIVVAKGGRTLGVGAGQMSRVDSVEIALSRVSARNLEGAVLASDAFFPFRDNIDRLKGTGLRAIIQPGGSQRDAEVIEACNEHGIAMVFTGQRHFRH